MDSFKGKYTCKGCHRKHGQVRACLLYTSYTETIPSLEKAKDMPGGDAAKASLEQIDKQIAEKFSGLSELGITVNGYADMPQAASTVAKTLVQVNTGIEQCRCV